MPRARNIKPGFFANEELAELPFETRLLFIGRGVPNKCQHDAVLAMGALRDRGVGAELRLVGSWGSNAAYLYRCLRLAEECGVRDRVPDLFEVFHRASFRSAGRKRGSAGAGGGRIGRRPRPPAGDRPERERQHPAGPMAGREQRVDRVS